MTEEITKKAKAAYKNGSEHNKRFLIDLFGKEMFDTTFLDDFELFCQENNIDYTDFITKYSNLDDNGLAHEMMKVIIKITNGEWKADWLNLNQKKWFPLFEYKVGSGFGFSYSNYVGSSAYTLVGSRLCFENENESKKTAIRFIKIYNKFLL